MTTMMMTISFSNAKFKILGWMDGWMVDDALFRRTVFAIYACSQ